MIDKTTMTASYKIGERIAYQREFTNRTAQRLAALKESGLSFDKIRESGGKLLFELLGSEDDMLKLMNAVLVDEQNEPFNLTKEDYLDMPLTMSGEMISDFFTLNPLFRELMQLLLAALIGSAADGAGSSGTVPTSGSTSSV